jgi:hypothetical protein
MSFYDTQTYCGIADMKVVVVGICNKIIWITPTTHKDCLFFEICEIANITAFLDIFS